MISSVMAGPKVVTSGDTSGDAAGRSLDTEECTTVVLEFLNRSNGGIGDQ